MSESRLNSSLAPGQFMTMFLIDGPEQARVTVLLSRGASREFETPTLNVQGTRDLFGTKEERRCRRMLCRRRSKSTAITT